MAAEAIPPSASIRPRSTIGRGSRRCRRRRAISSRRAGDTRRPRGAVTFPSRSRRYPRRTSESPAAAAPEGARDPELVARGSRRPGAAAPRRGRVRATVTDANRSREAERSPPTTATACSRAAARKPSRNPSSHATGVSSREAERQERVEGRRPHRGEVGEVDVQRLATDQVGVRAGGEVLSLDEGVRADGERRRRGEDGGVVADAHLHVPAARREEALEAAEEIVLGRERLHAGFLRVAFFRRGCCGPRLPGPDERRLEDLLGALDEDERQVATKVLRDFREVPLVAGGEDDRRDARRGGRRAPFPSGRRSEAPRRGA